MSFGIVVVFVIVISIAIGIVIVVAVVFVFIIDVTIGIVINSDNNNENDNDILISDPRGGGSSVRCRYSGHHIAEATEGMLGTKNNLAGDVVRELTFRSEDPSGGQSEYCRMNICDGH